MDRELFDLRIMLVMLFALGFAATPLASAEPAESAETTDTDSEQSSSTLESHPAASSGIGPDPPGSGCKPTCI